MKIVLQYVGKAFLFHINRVEKKEVEGDFFTTNTDYYISSKDGKIHRQKMTENIIKYVKDGIIYPVTITNNSLYEFLKTNDNINKIVEENLKSFVIDGDFSNNTNEEIITKLQKLLSEKEKEYQKKQEEKEKVMLEKLEKAKLEEEAEKQKIIKSGIEKVKSNNFIDNETFELLLNHYNINIHMRTVSWIRKKLVEIKKGSYRVIGKSRSEKAFECYNQLLKKINGELV